MHLYQALYKNSFLQIVKFFTKKMILVFLWCKTSLIFFIYRTHIYLCTCEMIRIMVFVAILFLRIPLEGNYFWGISYDCSTDCALNTKY